MIREQVPHARGLALWCGGLALVALIAAPPPAHALRATTWNLLQYPNDAPLRNPKFRTVMEALPTDLMIVQECANQAGADSFRLDVLALAQPKRWGEAYIPSTESAVYWDSSRVTVSSFTAIGTAGPRDVLQCLVKPVGYASKNAWFHGPASTETLPASAWVAIGLALWILSPDSGEHRAV